MSWLTSPAPDLVGVAVKVTLIYGTALLVLRVGERRTLAQWTTIDFAAAVAIGAIVGRTAVAKDQSYAVGAVALVTIVAVHRLASLLRFSPLFGKLQDHRIRVLVLNGELRRGQLRLCGLTDNDLYAELRLRGVFDLRELQYVLYETKGGLSLVRKTQGGGLPLVAAGLSAATGQGSTR
jgi:uncharacterized membrane protein YcaP (DUF421 family)